jgi:two-component system sensor histidine kinase FlrB
MEQQKLPTTRQKKPTRIASTTRTTRAAAAPRKPRAARKTAPPELTQPSLTFAQIAEPVESPAYSALRDEAARLREELANKNQQNEMALLLANQIRNPLGSLELFAGLLADSVDQHPETRQWVDHLQAGLRHVSATVHNTLHHHSLPEPRLGSVNLTRLLRETVEFLRPVARQKGMRVELSPDASATSIQAEAAILQQAFFNLALNAFRAMSQGGVLTISTGRENEAVFVSFSDTGSGVPAENLSRIFDAGFSSNQGSPGLGLAVCRKIIAQHGGDISVTSTVGKGSEFRILLREALREVMQERMAA